MTVEASVAIGADNSQLLRVLQESKSAMTEFFVSATEEGEGLGKVLEDMQGKFQNAFQFAGLTAGLEIIKQVGEAFEQMGHQAAEMKTASSVLGITTDEFQALKEAGEAAGVGQETLTRAGEKLVSMLTEARNNSGEAIEKLRTLGVTAEQIRDPTFKLNELFETLHDRLVNVDTEADTMNSLLLVLGNRAATASEALKHYDGSAEGVAEVMRAINGITSEQNQVLIEQGERWNEFATKSENAVKKAMVGLVDYSARLRETVPILKLIADSVGAPTLTPKSSSSGSMFGAELKDAQDAAAAMLATQEKAADEALKITLQNQHELVGAFREGTAQRVAALQDEYQTSVKYYGGPDVDKVRAVYQQLLGAQRAYFDAQVRASQEATAAEDKHVAGVLRGFEQQIDASGQYLRAQEQDASRGLEITRQQMQMDDQAAALRLKSISLSLGESERFLSAQERSAQQFQQRWGGAFRTFQSAFSSAIDSMLRGGESFGQAMRGVFASIAESALQNAVKNIATMAMQSLAGDAIRSAEIKKDAGAAAAGAYKAVVGIPYVGPFLAPAAAAVAYAGVLAFESAEGGYDIPGGVNPVTQLHQREMVLPAPIADTVRDAMGRGGTTVHIHGSKSSTFSQDQLASMLKSLGHRFKFV
jgi:hypothetical protein